MIKVPTIEVILFIMKAHGGQSRMGGEPYFTHPLACIDILRNQLGVKSDETDQAMAIHDVEEDTSYTLDELQDLFGEPADLAHWLCKPKRDPSTDKHAFNLNCYRRIANESPEACRQMKIADRLHNLEDPSRWNDRFRQNYIKDTSNFLVAFDAVPNIGLIRKRFEIIRDGGY